MNCGLDKSSRLLRKTEESLRTLYALREKLEGCSGVLRVYAVLERMKMTGLVRLLFRMTRPVLRKNLVGKHPSLWAFGIYKIGYYCCSVPREERSLRRS